MKKQNQSLADIELIFSIEYIFNAYEWSFPTLKLLRVTLWQGKVNFALSDNGWFLFNN